MKIYLSKINESWIVDRMKAEWLEYNSEISTQEIKEANIIWIISPWLWNKIPKKHLIKKEVVCSIYHFEEKDFTKQSLQNFFDRDKFVTHYHVISPKVKQQLENLTDKPITYIPFWVNQNLWFEIKDKELLRSKYGVSENSFLVGSFQRDTEGSDLISPKLIKGPDRFIEVVKFYYSKHNHLKVILTGKRRHYVIRELENLNIEYLYFEMADFETMNELYNLLDLYIVSSRIEGGPQAIVECGITKTPIISTDVGFATEILAAESIFDMNSFSNARPNVNYAFQKSLEIQIPYGFNKFIKMFSEINI